MVGQVYYSSWYSKLKKTHQNYWRDISYIAELIAFSLESGMHGYGKKRKRYSSITVHQYKEKFGEVRVYCTLGSPDLINDEYKESCKSIRQMNGKYESWLQEADNDSQPKDRYSTWIVSDYKSGRYPLKKPSRREFQKSCIIRDAIWYRSVYMKMIELFPKYEKAIKSSADYPHLLFASEADLNKYFDDAILSAKKHQTTPEIMKRAISHLKKDRELALLACFPSIK